MDLISKEFNGNKLLRHALFDAPWFLDLKCSWTLCWYFTECRLFVDESKLTKDVQRHLGVDVSAMETNSLEEVKVTVLPYDSVHEELKQLVCKLPEKIWVSRSHRK